MQPFFSFVIAARPGIVGMCIGLMGITLGNLVCTSEMAEYTVLDKNG
jgi:hypothetical protein